MASSALASDPATGASGLMPQGRRGRSALAAATLMTRAELPRLTARARRFLSCSSVSRSSASVSMNNVTNRGCMMSLLQFSCSRSDGQSDASGAVWRNPPATGKDLAHVVEHDDAVAQQAPSLLRVKGDSAGGIAIPVVSRGARGLV
jgi:hypothetical protein